MRTGSATARTTGRRTWLFCAAWLSIWPRWSPQKRRSRVSSSAPDGITPTWSPSSPKPQKAKCDSPVQKGQLKILAVSSPQRSFAAPDAPTLDEAGLSPFNLDIWVGLFAPRNTPEEIVARFNRDVNDVLRQPEIRTTLLNKGANITPMTMEQFAGFVGAETKRYATLIDTE